MILRHRKRLLAKLREQDGVTLTELLVAELIGGVALTAAAAVVMIAMNSSARVSDKVNAAAQGRTAIEMSQQRLRSQTCMFPQEYSVNGIVPESGGQRSFIHANPSKLIFVGDIGNAGGSTTVAGSVGYRPQLRYIWYDPGPTTGRYAGRRGKLMEGWKNATNTSIPFNFDLSPVGGVGAFDAMANVSQANSVAVTAQTVMAEGVTNEVSASNVPIPFFRYYNVAGVELPQTNGSVPTSSLGSVNRVNLTFKVLAESGNDDKTVSGGGKIDRRTASFSSDVYVRTSVDGCN